MFLVKLLNGFTVLIQNYASTFLTKMPLTLFWVAILNMLLQHTSLASILSNPEPTILLALKINLAVSLLLTLINVQHRTSFEYAKTASGHIVKSTK